jgi:hypothetical protein
VRAKAGSVEKPTTKCGNCRCAIFIALLLRPSTSKHEVEGVF